MKRALLIAISAFCLHPSVLALDRMAALSMLETGDNDGAVGRVGEISRFQIRPELWRCYGAGDPRDPAQARAAVERIMAGRLAGFTARFHRAATPFDFYVLWNAPAQIGRPSCAVAARARHFVNLCNR
jgi:hypothetical protein